MRISTSTARQLAIRCQGLGGQWKLAKGKEATAQVIERLGYVQIDTIAVVERAHHHTLWSRHPEHTPQMLHELQAQDRRVFEYWWAHGASYLPIRDYRYYLPRMRAFAERPRTHQWLQENAQVTKRVIARIRNEGPLGSADFKAPSGFKRGSWWSWKPAKRALETLFSMGKLMVTERRNFQRIYDLTERVLPAGTDTTEPDPGEVWRFLVRRTLASHGVVSTNEIRWGLGNWREGIPRAIEELTESGEVTPVEVRGLDGGHCYALTKVIEEASDRLQDRMRLHILSPFDNLVISRRRLTKLFDFEYRLECYVPASKRRYGYFCLPILWGERFVARLDPKADRKRKALMVRNIVFEPDFRDYDTFLPLLAQKLCEFAVFNGCEQVIVERTEPGKVSAVLEQQLNGSVSEGEASNE